MKTTANTSENEMDAIIKRDLVILKASLAFLGMVLNICIFQLVF